MKALTQDRYGTADVLKFRDIERPRAGDGQVLVRIVAAGMDRGAWHFMAGEPYLMRILGFGFRAPSVPVPGTNFAGVVETVAPASAGTSRVTRCTAPPAGPSPSTRWQRPASSSSRPTRFGCVAPCSASRGTARASLDSCPTFASPRSCPSSGPTRWSRWSVVSGRRPSPRRQGASDEPARGQPTWLNAPSTHGRTPLPAVCASSCTTASCAAPRCSKAVKVAGRARCGERARDSGRHPARVPPRRCVRRAGSSAGADAVSWLEHDHGGLGRSQRGICIEVVVDLGPARPQSLALLALCAMRTDPL